MDFDQLESDIAAIELSKRSVILHGPIVDYSTFEEYIERYEIPLFQNRSLTFGRRLGRGAIWTVFKGTITTAQASTDVAIKRLNLAIPQTYSDIDPYALDLQEQLAIASLEIRALTTPALRCHGNIARLLGVSWEDVGPEHDAKLASRRPLLIMELAELSHPTLDTLLEVHGMDAGLGLDDKCSILADIAEALNATHECGIIHGDLKPGNILMFLSDARSRYAAKISDFGGCQPSAAEGYDSSRIAANLEVFPLAGTRRWNAPEVSSEAHPHFRSKYRDYYSFGMVIYFTLFGALPCEQSNDAATAHGSENKANEEWITSVVAHRLSQSANGNEHDTDVRLYILSLAIVVLLRHEPEKRAKDRFVKDCRAFLRDKELGMCLRTVFRAGRWEDFIDEYLHDRRDLWEVSNTISGGRGFFAKRPEYNTHALSMVPLGDVKVERDYARSDELSALVPSFGAREAEVMFLKLLENMRDRDLFMQTLRERLNADHQFFEIALIACLSELLRVSAVESSSEIENTTGDCEELVAAVLQERADIVKQFLATTSKELIACTAGGMNMLQMAAYRGSLEIVEVILENGGIDINARTQDGLDALTLAVNALHCDVARMLRSHSASVDVVLNLGTLAFISNYGDLACLLLLEELLHGRSGGQESSEAMIKSFWNGEGDKRPTLVPPHEPEFHPVIAAVHGGNSVALWFLLERGSARDPEFLFNIAGHPSWLRPIHLAALLRPMHLALLLHYDADTDARTRPRRNDALFGDFTALHLACTAPALAEYLFPWVQKNQIDKDVEPHAYILDGNERNRSRLACIKLLAQASPATINTKDRGGLTALAHCMTSHKDVSADNVAMATTLVSLGADVRIVDNQGLTCLRRAILFNGDIGLVEFLLDQAVHLEARDNMGVRVQ
ncbi:hypothetical protein LTR85_007940 [Meristemomyces frigidus]|nr:hypothetical protein LTR85_007940 [Meristemomyces frigidus]